MADLNNVSFTGHLTRDADQKVLPTGTELVAFDIANNTGWGDYAKTLYLTCNLWGKQGKSLKQYLTKGQAVAVSGSLELQKWTSNQDGLEKQKLVINARDVILLASAKKDAPPQKADDVDYEVMGPDGEPPIF